jgi:hypothetical protein
MSIQDKLISGPLGFGTAPLATSSATFQRRRLRRSRPLGSNPYREHLCSLDSALDELGS